MQAKKIVFIGGGNMARCLVGGLINNGYPPDFLFISDPNQEKLDLFRTGYKVQVSKDNHEAIKDADVVVFAVKPQLAGDVIKTLATDLHASEPLIISIAAGIHTQYISQCLPPKNKAAIVRCMPNTPALLQAGATALFANSHTNSIQRDLAESIMRSVGITVWLDHEKDMDIVTALSGSGPAYFFFIMEALEKAAAAHGLSQKIVHLLTIQTALGASRMALESGESITTLRERVTSPGGTTEQAIKIFESRQLYEILAEGLNAAKNRSAELANFLET